jgi:hypothetical protein
LLIKAYENLTSRGKARRLRQLAIHALDLYELKAADVRLVGMYTNTLFRERLACGETCILRVCRPGMGILGLPGAGYRHDLAGSDGSTWAPTLPGSHRNWNASSRPA